MGEKKKVLIYAKTYPLPSSKYNELVCTGGILENGDFIRLYPIDYRYRPYWQWYKKYQWVEIEIEKQVGDPRPESFRPVQGTPIVPVGEHLKDWESRKKIVLSKSIDIMCNLRTAQKANVWIKSLGIIKPKQILDVKVEPDSEKWKQKWEMLFLQQELFGPKRKPLEKIPFKFKYHFLCEHPDCRGHKMMIEDWEVGQLYLNLKLSGDDQDTRVKKVREKLLDISNMKKRDVHFFVGTVSSHPTSWVIVGVFYPPKEVIATNRNIDLFDC
ncbi:MAG: hypothetical protein R3F48_01775 [Candidatus Zixiibacteriota bacterium]